MFTKSLKLGFKKQDIKTTWTFNVCLDNFQIGGEASDSSNIYSHDYPITKAFRPTSSWTSKKSPFKCATTSCLDLVSLCWCCKKMHKSLNEWYLVLHILSLGHTIALALEIQTDEALWQCFQLKAYFHLMYVFYPCLPHIQLMHPPTQNFSLPDTVFLFSQYWQFWNSSNYCTPLLCATTAYYVLQQNPLTCHSEGTVALWL